jgi:hypothetical protein
VQGSRAISRGVLHGSGDLPPLLDGAPVIPVTPLTDRIGLGRQGRTMGRKTSSTNSASVSSETGAPGFIRYS